MKASRAPLAFRFGRWLLRLLLGAIFNIEINDANRIPNHGGYILVANHLSWVDPFLLVALSPAAPRIHFLAPQEAVLNRWWKVWVMRIFGGAIFYRRSSGIVARDVVEGVREVLNQGGILGIFPEGKIGPHEGQLLPLHRGVAHFVVETRAPILPVALSGTSELYLHKRLKITIGEMFSPNIRSQVFGEQVREVTQEINAALHRLIEPYIEPAGVVKHWRWLTHLL